MASDLLTDDRGEEGEKQKERRGNMNGRSSQHISEQSHGISTRAQSIIKT